MSAPAVDLQAFAWAQLKGCEMDYAACSSLIRLAVEHGGRLPIREAAQWLHLTTTTTRGLAGRLQSSGLVALAGDAVYLLPLKREGVRG